MGEMKKPKSERGKNDDPTRQPELSSREIVEIPLAKLKPHPLQKEIYRLKARWQIEELAESMRQNGQEEPVEVTPDGMIICGHGRIAAATLLGWKTVRCWVRDDLAQKGPQAVEARLIESNLYRQQLSRLDMVRSYRHLKRLARLRRWKQASTEEVRGDVRDLIAKRFGTSGRTLDRWLQVLELPLPIQQAVEEGLPMTQAVKVASLDQPHRQRIAERIESGEDPQKVVDEWFPRGGRRHRHACDAFAAGHRGLLRIMDDLEGRIESVKSHLVAEVRSDLERAAAFIAKLLAQGRGKAQASPRRKADEEE